MKTDTKYSPTVRSNRTRFFGAMLILALMMPAVAFSQATVNLGAAATYGALASAGIVGTGTVYGDVGTVTSTVAPGIAVAGPGVNRGTSIGQANTDLNTAYLDAQGRNPGHAGAILIAADLISQTLTGGGVYYSGSGVFTNTGTLTLNGDANSVYIFQMTGALTPAASSHVILGPGVLWSKIFWQVGGAATLGASATFSGNILANAAITLGAGTTVQGRLLAGAVSAAAQVTLDGNTLGTALDPLPVELVSFTATANRMNANLHWSTATEINNYGFEIQRRQNADWSKVGFVSGAGTTNAPRDYSYTDNNLTSGRYTYRLKQVDNNGAFSYHGSVEVAIGGTVTTEFALLQNYPNPFNPSTQIQYSLQNAAQVSLKVYNVLGNEVATLVNGRQEAGSYTVPFNSNKVTPSLSSGVYLYRLEAGSFVSTKRLILMK